MFARKIYAQVLLHNDLIIHWCILESEFKGTFLRKMFAKELPDEEIKFISKCFNPTDFPEIKSEDFTKEVVSNLAPDWINQWEYNNNYCFIKARSSSVLDGASVLDVLGYIEHLQNRKKEEM